MKQSPVLINFENVQEKTNDKRRKMKKQNNIYKRILIVATNASALDDFHKTGVWLEEFAVPFLAFKEAGFEL